MTNDGYSPYWTHDRATVPEDWCAADMTTPQQALLDELERAADHQGPLDPVYARHLLAKAADALRDSATTREP